MEEHISDHRECSNRPRAFLFVETWFRELVD